MLRRRVSHHAASPRADDGLRNAVCLVMANKQDLPTSMRADKVAEQMGLRALRHNWYVQPCSATSGDGLYEGLEWLNTAIRAHRKASGAA